MLFILQQPMNALTIICWRKFPLIGWLIIWLINHSAAVRYANKVPKNSCCDGDGGDDDDSVTETAENITVAKWCHEFIKLNNLSVSRIFERKSKDNTCQLI